MERPPREDSRRDEEAEAELKTISAGADDAGAGHRHGTPTRMMRREAYGAARRARPGAWSTVRMAEESRQPAKGMSTCTMPAMTLGSLRTSANGPSDDPERLHPGIEHAAIESIASRRAGQQRDPERHENADPR